MVFRMVAARACRFDVDKIYAVLGMRSLPDDIHMAVGYEATVEDVYQELTYKYLQNGDTKVLHVAAMRWLDHNAYDPKTRQLHPSPTLPSWVSDWRHDYVLSSLSGYDFQAATNFPEPLSLDRKLLPVVGVGEKFVGRIKHGISTFFKAIGGKGFPINIKDLWPQHTIALRHREFASCPSNSYPMAEEFEEVFARLMVLDNRPLGAKFISVKRQLQKYCMRFGWVWRIL